jgi:4-hydroxy-tetrahydrodipicolinate synthase
LYAHFAVVAEGVDIPQIVYNIPGRCAVNIAPETIGRLAKLQNVVGVKEASGSMDQMSRVVELCGPEFNLMSGDDSMTLPVLALGGRGSIAVISNIMPKPFCELVRAGLAGDFAKAREKHYQLLPVMRALFLETNPIGIKAALALMGVGSDELRLPMTRYTDANRKELKKTLETAGVL